MQKMYKLPTFIMFPPAGSPLSNLPVPLTPATRPSEWVSRVFNGAQNCQHCESKADTEGVETVV
eukprot:scaffold15459_cov49-Cyclotella_meneghiniana.AAC.2